MHSLSKPGKIFSYSGYNNSPAKNSFCPLKGDLKLCFARELRAPLSASERRQGREKGVKQEGGGRGGASELFAGAMQTIISLQKVEVSPDFSEKSPEIKRNTKDIMNFRFRTKAISFSRQN